MNENEKLRARINELAKKAKETTLTAEEIIEQKELRQKFLANFRKSFKSQIEMLRIFDKDGNEVTSEKVKKIQKEKGLRD